MTRCVVSASSVPQAWMSTQLSKTFAVAFRADANDDRNERDRSAFDRFVNEPTSEFNLDSIGGGGFAYRFLADKPSELSTGHHRSAPASTSPSTAEVAEGR